MRFAFQNEFAIEIVDGAVNDVRIISYATILLILCVVIVGVSFEAKAQLVLLAVLALSLVDYLIGTFIPPDKEKQTKGMTGYSFATLQENFFPLWGSQNFFSVFSVFFPACTGKWCVWFGGGLELGVCLRYMIAISYRYHGRRQHFWRLGRSAESHSERYSVGNSYMHAPVFGRCLDYWSDVLEVNSLNEWLANEIL